MINTIIAVVDGSQTILYAGDTKGGLWQGLRSGSTWQRIQLLPQSPPITDLVFQPGTGQILYAITLDAVFRIHIQGILTEIEKLPFEGGIEGAMPQKHANVILFTTISNGVMLMNFDKLSEPIHIAPTDDLPEPKWIHPILITPESDYVVFIGTGIGLYRWHPSRQRAAFLK